MGVLATMKCNHDITIALRLPPDFSGAAATADAINTCQNMPADFHTTSEAASQLPPQTEEPAERVCAAMVASMTALIHYITDYTGKAQPQLTNLWKLLADGQRKLQTDLLDLPSEKRTPAYKTWRVCCRLLTCCQKRVHKSMQEMVAYLLQYPEYIVIIKSIKNMYGETLRPHVLPPQARFDIFPSSLRKPPAQDPLARNRLNYPFTYNESQVLLYPCLQSAVLCSHHCNCRINPFTWRRHRGAQRHGCREHWLRHEKRLRWRP